MATTTADNKMQQQKEIDPAAAIAAASDPQTLMQNISLPLVYGACVGSATKKFSKDVAYGVGVGFIFLQSLSHYGFIDIHWGQINKKVQEAIDQDGDGKFDANDVKIMARRFINFLKNGLPDAAGFSVGFYAGLKYL